MTNKREVKNVAVPIAAYERLAVAAAVYHLNIGDVIETLVEMTERDGVLSASQKRRLIAEAMIAKRKAKLAHLPTLPRFSDSVNSAIWKDSEPFDPNA